MNAAQACFIFVCVVCCGSNLKWACAAEPPSSATTKLFSLRWFAEPLAPTGTNDASGNADALWRDVEARRGRFLAGEKLDVLRELASAHSSAAFGAALLTNLGIEEFQNGYFTRALASWEKAWQLGKADTSPHGKAVVDRAFAELTRMHARLGHFKELEGLFKESERRDFNGSPQAVIEATRSGYWSMLNNAGESFKCGPAALGALWSTLHPGEGIPEEIIRIKSTQQGIRLRDVRDLSQKVGLHLQAAKRSAGAPLIAPCVVHWKQEHYGAIIKEKDGKFLLKDTTFGFGGEIWMPREAVEEESSGYFLVAAGPLPAGWTAVSDEATSAIWGKGETCCVKTSPPNVCKVGCTGGCKGGKWMATWSFNIAMASLAVADIPLSYHPPVGPAVALSVNYDQREENQPAVPLYSNFGPKWSFEWVHSLTFDSTKAYLNSGSGGVEEFADFNTTTQSYAIGVTTVATLTKIATDHYELHENDGGKQVFDVADGSGRLFRSRIIDPQGNELVFGYDANFRLATVTDEIGQVTSLTHGSNTVGNALFYRVTLVTDPFGRTAQFDYNGSAQLIKITDTAGLTSEFTYGTGDFLQTLTTGYGVTTFSWGAVGSSRWLETQHPNGDKERLESLADSAPHVAASEPGAQVPTGMSVNNAYLNFRNCFYWDRKAFKAGTTYGNARLYHFVHYALSIRGHQMESTREPYERRVWYNYHGQSQPQWYNVGMTGLPSKIGRVLDDGTTQLTRISYNAQGRATETIDPLGRTTRVTYATNGIDLLEVNRVVENLVNERLLTATWNAQHRPLTLTDQAGQTTSFTYNARGQVLTLTNAKGEITTRNYDPNGYLTSVDGPLPGTADSTSFTYDGHGRVQTVTDSEGYTLSLSYDLLDRPTRITYPDTTYQELTYALLDVDTSRDRRGRITDHDYDSLGQLVKTTDPLNRVTRYAWCRCGALKSLIDALGRETRWEYDLQGRKTAKVYADGSRIIYGYENTTSRLKSVTDAKGQVKNYEYFGDDRLRSVSYPRVENWTPDVSWTYDQWRGREMTRTDGTGLTQLSYHPITSGVSPGAGRLAQIDGPLPNDNITYSYDELGRVLSRSIGGVPETMVYDALGRTSSINNALGTFAHTYINATQRPDSVTYPNGQSTVYDYFPNNADQRLKQIWHKLPGGGTLSKFDYTYDLEGQIQTWSQQSDSNPARLWTYGYDLADQLTSASGTNPVTSYGYTMDAAGNRLTEIIDGVTKAADYNSLNQLVNLTNETSADKTYEWDAEDRLVAIVSGTRRSEFSYDGLHRRVRIIEKENNVVTSDKRFVWCGTRLCEERNALGSVVVKRFLTQGVVDDGTKYFYTRDHLGSIRELCDNAGAVSAAYEYDPYGRRTQTAGTLASDFGFTGHYLHFPSSLHLAPYRAYESSQGRWLSRDSIGEAGGINLYSYVENEPIGRYDPLGLESVKDAAWIDIIAMGARDPYKRLYPRDQLNYVVEQLKEAQKRLDEAKSKRDKDWCPWNYSANDSAVRRIQRDIDLMLQDVWILSEDIHGDTVDNDGRKLSDIEVWKIERQTGARHSNSGQ